MAAFTVYLTLKNGLSFLVGSCVVGLALIPLVVPAAVIGLGGWKIVIIALAVVGLVALFCQAARQSREETEQWNTIRGMAAKLETLLPSKVPLCWLSLKWRRGAFR